MTKGRGYSQAMLREKGDGRGLHVDEDFVSASNTRCVHGGLDRLDRAVMMLTNTCP
jgi:hypothetical protein